MNRYFNTKQVLLIKMVLTIHNWHILGFCRIRGWRDRWYLWTFGVDSGNNNPKFWKLSLGVEGPGLRSSAHGHLTAGEGKGGMNWESRIDIYIYITMAQTVKNLQCRRPGFHPWVGKIPWKRARQPTPAFLHGESTRTEKPGGLQCMGLQRVGHD